MPAVPKKAGQVSKPNEDKERIQPPVNPYHQIHTYRTLRRQLARFAENFGYFDPNLAPYAMMPEALSFAGVSPLQPKLGENGPAAGELHHGFQMVQDIGEYNRFNICSGPELMDAVLEEVDDCESDTCVSCNYNFNIAVQAMRCSSKVFSRLVGELQCEPDVMLEAVRQDAEAIKKASPAMRADIDFVMEAVKINPATFKYADESLKADREVVIKAIHENPRVLRYADHFRSDRRLVAEAIARDPWALDCGSPEMLSDKELVLMAVRSEGCCLFMACPELKNDLDVIVAAAAQDPSALRCVSPKLLQKSSELAMRLVQEKGELLQFLPLEFQRLPEVAMSAVSNDGGALRFVPDSARSNAVVMAAVNQNGFALEFATDAQKDSPNLVLAAAKQNGFALQFAAKRLRQNWPFCTSCIHASPMAIGALTATMSEDDLRMLVEDIVGKEPQQAKPICEFLQACATSVLCFARVYTMFGDSVTTVLCTLHDTVGTVLQRICMATEKHQFDGTTASLAYMDDTILDIKTPISTLPGLGPCIDLTLFYPMSGQKREEFLQEVTGNGMRLCWAGPDLKDDLQVVLAAVQQNAMALQFAGMKMRANRDVVLEAVKQNGLALQFAGLGPRGDYGIVEKAVMQNGLALQYACAGAQHNVDIASVAVQQNPAALQWVPATLQNDPRFSRPVSSASEAKQAALSSTQRSYQ
mmetsp:Transcript_23672/g.55220  ORF Transcript_23672/g.55220 Transcript_23672/m.55220 type:complete len:699 (-) Transcript_23672:57-2153(-)